jgi:hypothetical protein
MTPLSTDAIGKCTASHNLVVGVSATPNSPIITGTKIQLNGVALESRILPSCESSETSVPFKWKLTFQPTGGAETDITKTLTGASTTTPFFTPATDGTYRATLTVNSTTLGSKSTVAAINVLPAAPVLLESQGLLTFLRVHDLGTDFGPPDDLLNVEVVAQIDSEPGKSFGFQLRNDKFRPSREGQLDLLRDAFNNNWTVLLDYFIVPGKENGVLFRTAVIKQQVNSERAQRV